MTRNIFPALAVGLLLLLATDGALAYAFIGQPSNPNDSPVANQTTGIPVIWPDNKVDVPITLNFDTGFSASAVQAMDESWNAQGTRLQLQQGFSAGTPCRSDGINAAGWSDTTCGGSQFGDALAITVRNFRFNNTTNRWEIADADIVFDQGRAWAPSVLGPDPVQAGDYDFHRVFIHELGHVLGLDHPDEAGQTVSAIMNSTVGALESLQDDDRNGLAFLYGGSFGNSINSSHGGGRGGGGASDLALSLMLLLGIFLRKISAHNRRYLPDR